MRNRCIFALLMLVLFPLSALEIESGAVRLVLHEGMGRFSLYIRSPSAPSEYIPLFVDQDPRTSGLTLVVNDKLYKLGESADFSESTAKSTNPLAARFIWTSRSLEIVQEFTLVSEGVRMSIRIANRSRSSVSAGLKLCLDTYLGEANLSHFSSDRRQEIRNELTVSASDMTRFWLSPSATSPQTVGLLCLTAGADITSPDRIVFANWKRLSEASWDYETSSRRNFNLMPYSINDSAVCMYYDPVDLPAEGKREIVLVLGNVTMPEYGPPASVIATTAAQSAQTEADSLLSLLALRESLSSRATTTEQDLDVLNSLVNQIDQLLDSGESISDEQLRLMEEILSAIKDKSERYSGEH